MKKGSTIFLKGVLVLVALLTLFLLILLPKVEGRAADLDLLHIYADPFIIFGYIVSIPFFVVLFQAFRLLGYIGQNNIFSTSSVHALRTIKISASAFALLMIMALVYIRVVYDRNDDPAGFIAIGVIATFVAAVVATTAGIFEKTTQKGVDLQSEHDLTV